MFLKKIELKGFKSFADRTVIDFEQGITCIVGPNGSGKSNVTDAFRWVLGEQKFKTLRGSQMQDVIFNGTTKRKALGFAEVAITFDNLANLLPLPYNEVTVLRRLFRSGESEYAINGQKCRLKDIKELFMDTGVGVEGYSIIGQGRIESILSTNKDERRLILEEAAGIVKYRSRKEEAQRKLERTGQNLDRIEDIVKELEERVGPLKEQSEKATLYVGYAAQLKDLEINLFINEVEQVDSNLTIILDELRDKESANQVDKVTLEGLLEQSVALESQLKEFTEEEHHLNNQVQRLNQTVTQLNHDIDLANERHRLIEGNIAQMTTQQQDDGLVKEHLEKQLNHLQEKLKYSENHYQESHQAFLTLQGQRDTLTLKREQLKAQTADNDTKQDVAREELQKNQLEVSRLEMTAQVLQERLQGFKLDVAIYEESQANSVKDLSKAQHQLDEEDQKLIEIEKKRIALQEAQGSYQKDLSALQERLYHHTANVAKHAAKRDALVEQENQQEGFSHAVKQVLDWSKNDSQVLGCVKDIFKIDKQFETAIETALGRNLQNIVVSHEDVVDSYIERLKEERAGRATFMPLNSLEPREIPKQDAQGDYYGCALHHVQCDPSVQPALQYLLSNVYFCEHLSAAKQVAKKLPKGSRVVTVQGEILNVGGTVTGGSLSKRETGFLKRKREIEELNETLESLELEIATCEQERKTLQEALLTNRRAFDASEDELTHQKNTVMTYRLALDQVREVIAKASTGKGKVFQESQVLTQQLEEVTEQIEHYKRLDDELIEALELSKETIVSNKQAIDELESELGALAEQLTITQIQDARREEEMKAQRQSLIERQEQLDALLKSHARRQFDIETLKTTLLDLEQTVTEKGRALDEHRGSRLEFEENLQALRVKIEAYRANLQSVSIQVEHLRQKVSSMNDMVFRLQIDQTRLETKRDNILQNLWEKYELSYIHALDHKHDFDLKAYATEAKKLKTAIKALGEVNIGAIKEYDTVNERYTFLSEQKADLIEAKQQLLKLIKEMDREMRQSFKDKLAEINTYFKETFSSLFGGGFGDITAEGHDDILEAEIVIHAQPPGKKLQSLDLMSGGEKALTAIALLFAILKTKPSPFCILDEIEAALDDVNIHRFAVFVQEFVRNSQFIIITHRKGTMEIARSLYGVTMQEQGISTVLSVHLADAEKLTAE